MTDPKNAENWLRARADRIAAQLEVRRQRAPGRTGRRRTWWIMTDPMTGPRLVDSPCNGATLPNCDCCGRFTSRPTRVDSWRGGAGMFVCAELLLCPHCTDNCSLIITHKETR